MRAGADVLVTGPTSQILAQAMASAGASRVTAAAPTQFELDVARTNGMQSTILLVVLR